MKVFVVVSLLLVVLAALMSVVEVSGTFARVARAATCDNVTCNVVGDGYCRYYCEFEGMRLEKCGTCNKQCMCSFTQKNYPACLRCITQSG
ncbi:hypothetical protein AAVH_07700 [Aphelenchoides avenae]|nr:hypothetical protein AAVH_07698 [Aphelenchus avenae]KAH7724830.1 hypothetical protein AAVH_07699 [Aphelenchus avenae]KAH7724831.1 hypothetical protein AAVH_07700 [Aphelenchus avenae]